MYYNNYYFSRPNYGYAYGNPYGLNFSRRYPRVVSYNFGFLMKPKLEMKPKPALSGFAGPLGPSMGGRLGIGSHLGSSVGSGSSWVPFCHTKEGQERNAKSDSKRARTKSERWRGQTGINQSLDTDSGYIIEPGKPDRYVQ